MAQSSTRLGALSMPVERLRCLQTLFSRHLQPCRSTRRAMTATQPAREGIREPTCSCQFVLRGTLCALVKMHAAADPPWPQYRPQGNTEDSPHSGTRSRYSAVRVCHNRSTTCSKHRFLHPAWLHTKRVWRSATRGCTQRRRVDKVFDRSIVRLAVTVTVTDSGNQATSVTPCHRNEYKEYNGSLSPAM
jgi:hypothetical protein